MPRTPTETLMDALAECETAQNCVIIIEHSDGAMSFNSSTDQSHRNLGMVEFVATRIRKYITELEAHER